MCSGGVEWTSPPHVQQSRPLLSATCAAVEQCALLCSMGSSGAHCPSLLSRVKRAELHTKQGRECREHNTLLQIEWRAQISNAMEWKALWSPAKGVESTELHCKKSRAPQQTVQRVQRAQYSNANGVESAVLHCKWSGENSAPELSSPLQCTGVLSSLLQCTRALSSLL